MNEDLGRVRVVRSFRDQRWVDYGYCDVKFLDSNTPHESGHPGLMIMIEPTAPGVDIDFKPSGLVMTHKDEPGSKLIALTEDRSDMVYMGPVADRFVDAQLGQWVQKSHAPENAPPHILIFGHAAKGCPEWMPAAAVAEYQRVHLGGPEDPKTRITVSGDHDLSRDEFLGFVEQLHKEGGKLFDSYEGTRMAHAMGDIKDAEET